MIVSTRGSDILRTLPQFKKRADLLSMVVFKLYQMAFENADWVTSTSISQLQKVNQLFGINSKISLIRTGVDLTIIKRDTRHEFPMKDQKSYILFPRYLKPVYNHEFCLSAIKRLTEAMKIKYRFVFVGEDGSSKEYISFIKKTIQSFQDLDIVLLPKQTQGGIIELYKRASLIIMTPKSDGSPVSAMEAIALSKKLILGPILYDDVFYNVNNVHHLTEWDKHELCGLIVKVLGLPSNESSLQPEILKEISRDYNMMLLNKIYSQMQSKY
jgi:hypothetical protein